MPLLGHALHVCATGAVASCAHILCCGAGVRCSNQRCVSCPSQQGNDGGGGIPAGLWGLIFAAALLFCLADIKFLIKPGNSKEEEAAAGKLLRRLVAEGRKEDLTVAEFQQIGTEMRFV